MLSLEDTRRDLADDVASLTRVRNRLSKSSDQQLRKIIPALVPKLLERLEKYRTLIINEDDNEDDTKQSYLDSLALSHLEEAKKKTNEIVANTMEWLRGNEVIPVVSLVRVILPFVNSKNPVVGTWALAFLQVSLQKILMAESLLSSSVIPSLLKSLDQLYRRLLQSKDSLAVDAPLESQWIGVSWLLLDSIVLHSGKPPMIDWDMEWDIDSFTTAPKTRRQRLIDDGEANNENQGSPNPLSLREAIEGRSGSGKWVTHGVLSLVLDLLFYWPRLSRFSTSNTTILSPLGVRRMEHRITTNNAKNADDGEQIFLQWSDSNLAYLRYMKLACFEFFISLPSRGFTRGLNSEYSIVLSILFASHESMHGRIAMSYLKRLSAENSLVSLSVVTNILVLIIGETEAEELLDSYERKYKISFWELLIGSKSSNKNFRRPAVGLEVGVRAADFLIENQFNWKGSIRTNHTNPLIKKYDASDELYATLFIELSLKLSEVNHDEHKYMAMRLVTNFYPHMKRPQTAIVCKIFDLIITILTIVANSDIGEDLRTAPRNDDQIAPGLLHIPFGGRNDLNKLLQSHRQSMKRRNLDRGSAIEARADAYAMIPLISVYLFERSDASKFRLPILLLRCAVYESRCLENCLTKALDSTLAEYKIKFDKDQSLMSKDFGNDRTSSQQQATFILPALLETVSSGAEYVRTNAIKWIEKLLVYMDAEAARYLAAHLIHDENQAISRMAKSIIYDTKTDSPPIVAKNDISVTFFDLEESDGLLKVKSDLKNRSKELAQRLNLSSCEESVALLLHFKFSVKRAEFEYRKNSRACQNLCGLVIGDETSMKEEIGYDVECGICYVEMEAQNSYSLWCGHTFCKSCWVSYAIDASKETPSMNFLDLRCPYHGCNTRVMLRDLQRLEPRLIPKWNDAILRKFIEEDTSYRYCSGPNCRCVAMRTNQLSDIAPHSMKVTCTTCTTSFCFGCGENAHTPASCQDISKWNLLNKSSQLWVKHHSKP